MGGRVNQKLAQMTDGGGVRPRLTDDNNEGRGGNDKSFIVLYEAPIMKIE